MTISNEAAEERSQNDKSRGTDVTFFTILHSVFASFIGVQSNKNRVRDFESGKVWHFVAAGIVFVLVFLLVVWGAVKYLIATT